VSFQSRNFQLLPEQVRVGAQLVDGGSSATFVPRTAYLSVGGNDAYPPQSAVTDTMGWVTFKLSGLHLGAPYVRRFSLWNGTQVRIPIVVDGVNFTIEALGAITPPQAPIQLILTDQPTTGTEPAPYLWLATSTSGVERKRTPDGARRMIPGVVDAGFRWLGFGPVVGELAIVQAQAIGVPVDVGGPIYRPSVDPFTALWQIEV
jgi:hypothetical protein